MYVANEFVVVFATGVFSSISPFSILCELMCPNFTNCTIIDCHGLPVSVIVLIFFCEFLNKKPHLKNLITI